MLSALEIKLLVLRTMAYCQASHQSLAKPLIRLAVVGRLAAQLARDEPEAAEPAAILAQIRALLAGGDQGAAQAYMARLGNYPAPFVGHYCG